MSTARSYTLQCNVSPEDYYVIMLAYNEHLRTYRNWNIIILRLAFAFFLAVGGGFLVANLSSDNLLDNPKYLFWTGFYFCLMTIVGVLTTRTKTNRKLREIIDNLPEEFFGRREYSLESKSISYTTDISTLSLALNAVTNVKIIDSDVIIVEHPLNAILIPPMAFENEEVLIRFAETIREYAVTAGCGLDCTIPLKLRNAD